MAAEAKITPDMLRQFTFYDPDSGAFVWKPRVAADFPNAKNPLSYSKTWNGSHAGAPAFNTPHCEGYVRGCINAVQILAHRAAWAHYFGEWPKGQIDHINGNRKDNRINNLREVSALENNHNRMRSKRNTYKTFGVSRSKSKNGGWNAKITNAGVYIFLGAFDTLEEACAARKGAERALGFHENHGRLPPPR